MSEVVSIGVVGLGTIAQTQHLPSLGLLADRFRVETVTDLSSTLTAAVAADLPGEVTTARGWREVCANPAVDAVLLLTPGAHEVMTQEALAAGKHVFTEKPLCLTVAGATRLNALARERGLVLQVGYMKPHERPLDELRRALERIGTRRLIRHTVFHPTPEAQLTHTTVLRFDDLDRAVLAAASRFEEERTVEALGEVPAEWGRLYRDIVQGSLVHTVSLLRLLLGDLPIVGAAGFWPPEALTPTNFGPPNLTVGGRFGDDARFEMDWLWLPDYPVYREVLEVHSTAGSLELELPPPYVRDLEATLTVRTADGVVRHGGGIESAFLRELEVFHTAVTAGTTVDEADGAAVDIAWLQRTFRLLAAGSGIEVAGEASAG